MKFNCDFFAVTRTSEVSKTKVVSLLKSTLVESIILISQIAEYKLNAVEAKGLASHFMHA